MAVSCVLLQIGDDPFNTRFEDLEGRTAFTLCVPLPIRTPNALVQLRRETPWTLQHRDIMGPSAAFFYFGPANMPGYIVYGNTPSQPMTTALRKKRGSSGSRFFTSQSGRQLKWKLSAHRMECVDGKQLMAVYEPGHQNEHATALLTIKQPGLAVVTEILTTLMLIRMSAELHWAA
ncbi:hypothetical protein FA95DRAFT_1668236 [Auriscalpium vulgare]|uniref:Uncharacterized protein n=1 Tax=Auriscalpium vulgare TaxID=40419 RepID=A0ACB8RR51_9AGAM|nr:hypothetical protein FA95DRAFT_1668236 [Auriscalpium vulgare]